MTAAPGPIRDTARALVGTPEVGAECARLVAQVRERCPEAFPADPLPPSGRGPDLPLDGEGLLRLFRAAADGGAGRLQLWQRDGDELLVHVDGVELDTRDGIVLAAVPVECDQTGRAVVQVAFAVGSADRPAGMVAAAQRRPRGPAVVVEAWSDELTAFVWRAFTTGVSALARETGTDLDGAGLVPFGIEASRAGLLVRTIARHAFDRVGR